MKRLYLLRHAKSSWHDASLTDRERPLNARGQRDAPRMGRHLGETLAPMTFWVSPAERAQQTFSGLASGWSGLSESHRVTTEALYTFDYERVLDWLADQPDATPGIALIGHNPALTELMHFLAAGSGIEHLVTCAWVALTLEADRWAALPQLPGCATVVSHVIPRQLATE